MLEVHIQQRIGAFSLDARFEGLDQGGITVVSGPSGAGKSSLLRAIAGLARPDAGRVVVGGRVLFDAAARIDLPAHQRRVGVVFQDSRLFPHRTVASNLRYGQPSDRPRLVEFDEVVDLLGIGALLDRRPGALSGGEKQRVAVGRALLASPDLLIMDEPLASLDQARKDSVLPFLAALPTRLRLPILYVTHSLDELLLLADEVVVLEAGRVVASGALADVASALRHHAGADALFDGTVQRTDDTGVTLTVGAHTVQLMPVPHVTVGDRLRVRVGRDDLILATGPTAGLSVRNQLPARVVSLDARAGSVEVRTRLDPAVGADVVARVTPAAAAALELAPGAPVTVLIKATSIRAPGMTRGRA